MTALLLVGYFAIAVIYIGLENYLDLRARVVRKGTDKRFLRVGNGLVAMPNVGSCRKQHHPADSSHRFRQNTALF
jgi:hypothetical protein